MNEARTPFTRVYEEHVWRVFGFFGYRLRDRDLAEDLTQATFERALRAWPRFDPARASEGTWLLAIAHNLLVDQHRRTSAEPVAEVDERLLSSVDGPEVRIGLSPELDAALGQLSDREREVIALRFGGDLSGPEIAELLGISLANAQQILSRSLRKLRSLLEVSTR